MSYAARQLLSATAVVLALALPAPAEVRALLVGVSDYERIDADLRGPGNDVRILAAALLARGVAAAQISVLSDRAEGLPAVGHIGRPTRNAILSGLDRLAAEARPGDTVVFFFSGHGSQQPDTDGDEQGGMDEIFLPIDAGRWSGAAGGVENAIIDDEFRARAEAILATGARFVGMLDACHSATGFRAVGDDAALSRYVAPASLGVPAAEGTADGSVGPALAGEYVFLYSAQADQRAFEYPLGEAPGPDDWYGEFTRNVVAVLGAAPDLTWRQLVQAATDGMRSEGTIAIQRPEAEGPLLDTPVFLSSGVAEAGAARYRIAGGEISTGLLTGVRDGAVIALHPDAVSAEVLDRAVLRAPGPERARLEMADGSALPAAATFGSVLDPGAAPPLRFSVPLRTDPSDGHDYAALELALAGLQGDADLPYGFAASGYDVALLLAEGTLAVAGRDGTLDGAGPGTSLRLALAPDADLAVQLEDALGRIARVHLLQTALDRAGGKGGGLLLSTNALKSALAVLPGRTAADGNRCASAGDLTAAKPVREPVALHHCDVAVLTLRNLSSKAQDVTVLYVDGGFGISALWPSGDTSNRIAFNETVTLPLRIATRDARGRPLPLGAEQLVVLSVPAPPDTKERTVLTGLVQDGVSRGADPTGIEGFLRAAMDPERSSRALGLGTARPSLNVTRHQFFLQSNPG